jgi:hypothetical protein
MLSAVGSATTFIYDQFDFEAFAREPVGEVTRNHIRTACSAEPTKGK